MYSLLKMTFWISLILLIIPIGTGSDEEAPAINPLQALVAAQSTVSDLSGFCERNPAACETGNNILELVGMKAKQAARLAYSYLVEEENAEGVEAIALEELPADVMAPVSEAIKLAPIAEIQEQITTGTLTSDDLQIPWQLSAEETAAAAKAIATAPAVVQELVENRSVNTQYLSIPLPRPNPRS
ncbi:hypothetical protein E1162_17015 [Rhodobacteraceae bacterium RKSG542]|nr:hypothetical protein [Pseudovibrio flavus]